MRWKKEEEAQKKGVANIVANTRRSHILPIRGVPRQSLVEVLELAMASNSMNEMMLKLWIF